MNFNGRKYFGYPTVTVSYRSTSFIHSAITVLEDETPLKRELLLLLQTLLCSVSPKFPVKCLNYNTEGT